MKRAASLAHRALWATWRGRLIAALAVLVAEAPRLAPADLSAWMVEQFPWAPSWACEWTSVGILLARLGFMVSAREKKCT